LKKDVDNMRKIITNIFKVTVILALSFLSISVSAYSESSRAVLEARQQAQFNLIKAVQMSLTQAGYNPGPVDGLDGSKTDKALRSFQSDKGLKADGVLGPKTMKALGLSD